jgi:hypothetical protein
MNKRILIPIFITVTIVVSFSQELESKQLMNLPANYIISDQWMLSMGYFQLVNGSRITDKDGLKLLSQCPENIPLLNNERIWKISFLSTMGISTGTLATMLFYKIKNQYTNDVDFWCSPILASSLMWSMVSALQENHYRNKATNNYNLYILGFNIP